MNNLPNPRLLIIGPAFFSYTNAIKTELNNHGIFCTVFNQLHSDSVLSKLAYRLKLHAVFFKQINAHREKIYQEIKHQNITDVLFISPDIIDRSFLIEIKKYAKVHLYMWDGFKNKKSAESCLDLFHTKSSFDNFDCDKYGMIYIPLFAEDTYKSKGSKKTYDISFCGTVHSDRPTWIKKFDKFSIQKKLQVKFLLFYYSPILLLLRLTLNRFAFDLYGSISFTSFSKKEIAETFEMSNAVIDITHPNQIGMTSRTFEALRSGSKLVTNNQNCSILPDEFQSRIFVLEGLDFCEDSLINFIKSDIIPLTNDQDYYLSLKRFTKQILEQIHD